MNTFKQQLSFRKVPRVLRLIITSLLSISADYVTALADTKKVSLLTLPIGTLLYYLYLLFCFLRLIIAIFVLNWNLLPDYLHYDVLLEFFVRKHFIDSNLAFVFWLAIPMVFYLDYAVHLLRGLRCFRLAHDLLVVNTGQFFTLNPQLSVGKAVQYFWKHLSENQTDRIKLNVPKLTHLPQLHHSIRCRAALLSTAFNVFIALYVVLFGLFCLALIIYYFLTEMLPFNSLTKSLVFLIDFLLIGYIFWNSSKIAIFLVHSTNLGIYVLVAQQAVMNGSLQILLNAKSPKSKICYIQLVIYLERYIGWNFQFIVNILLVNKEFVSFMLLIAALTMLGAQFGC